MTSLADIIYAGDNPNLPTVARVDAVNGNGTVDLDYLGGVAKQIPVVASYAPASGDVVQIMRVGAGRFLVLGPMRTQNVTSSPIRADLVVSYNVEPVPNSAASTSATGTFTFDPVETRSYRSGTGWQQDSDFVAQGAYETRYGYYQGCWFYGGNWSGLKGRQITRVRMDLGRLSGSGVFAAEPIHLYLLQNGTRPAGAPFFGQYVGDVGPLAVNQKATVDLPTWVAERFRDGQSWALGIQNNSTADYLRLMGKSQMSNSGRLTIDWKE